jgi:antitoxin component YwqK of YwqJK toxin-antitoxin module
LKFYITILSLVVVIACNRDEGIKTVSSAETILADTIHLPDKLFAINNGVAYFKSKVYTGYALNTYSSGTLLKVVAYQNGREDGFTITYYPGGNIESKRYYTAGEKDGVHLGWWDNGNKRFEYHFKNGSYNGAFHEFYEDGSVAKKINYKDCIETDGMGWRENGKVYMSFVMKGGRRYGLVNSKLCYSVKNERGEYVNNVSP